MNASVPIDMAQARRSYKGGASEAPHASKASESPAYHDSRFAVPGIRCAGCMAKIERGLSGLHGVAAARVNFSAKQVAVSHDALLTEDRLRKAIEELGFEAQILADNPLSEDRGDTARLLRALAVAGFGMMNIMLLSVSIWSGAAGVTRDVFHMLSALIAIPVIAYSGRPFFASAVMALRYRRTNMDVPISIGILLATGLSFYETITGGVHAYFDGAVMLLFFLLAGRVLDGMMRDRAREGISALLKQTPSGAMVVQADGSTVWTKTSDIVPDMVILVAAGENLAADGVVIQGESGFDMAMLTGESAPQACKCGDEVLAGTTNLLAPVHVRVTASGGDTSIADIARLMDDAGQHRSLYVRVADRAARYYAPVVHSLALLGCAGWMLAGAGWHQALLVAVSVLIITCPCALGLAVPAAQVVTAGALMRKGVLIKDGSALERLAEADYAIFDKTGTLTMGRPEAMNIGDLTDAQKAVALALAQSSRHPLSKGLAAALRSKAICPADVQQIGETGGEGVHGLWGDIPVSLGRAHHEYDIGGSEDRGVGGSSKGASMGGSMGAVLTIGGTSRAICFHDRLRPDAQATVDRLRGMAMRAAIISGDHLAPVAHLAKRMGISFLAQARPEDKVAAVEKMTRDGHKVLMVGDGLNDGPALAAAYVSMAPGSASDVGQQAADAVFTSDSLMSVALAVTAARKTGHIVRQNFAAAICYNMLAVPLALAGQVTPLIAALAMSLSSLIVVGNSLRLRGAAK